jgi:hypothetical protein
MIMCDISMNISLFNKQFNCMFNRLNSLNLKPGISPVRFLKH